jgi:2-dehydro-3-deoxyphosphogluconate aldolase/(4S)-4-hydroxy-2-oxoglutarate aldolase
VIAKDIVLASLRATGVVAVIRTEEPRAMVSVAKSLAEGGIKFVEITMTVPGAIEIIREATSQLKGTDIYIGPGTVLDAPTARAAILAGAAFVVGPCFDPEIAEMCHTYGVFYAPGAMTPQEIITAWKGGADVVKIFPAENIGGPGYLKTIKEPFPQIELMPTKGVNFDTAAAYIKAGAIAVGVGTAVVSKAQMAAKDFAGIAENARKFSKIVRDAKGGN